jgi:hypothetical protein
MEDEVIVIPTPEKRVPWKGKLTGAKPAAAAETRLVDPDEAPDRRPRSRPRMSSGSRRAERAVEPARSENSTVSCLRSASACGEGPGSSEAAPAGDTGGIVVCAAKTRLRSPSVKPSSRRSASVSDASTSRSMPFSRNVASSRDRPTRASHSWIVTETPLQRTAISRVPTDLIALYHPARSPSRELLEDDRALGSCSARLRLLSLLLAPERTWTFGAFYPGHDVWRFFFDVRPAHGQQLSVGAPITGLRPPTVA